MIRGRVTGRVWSSKTIDTLPGGALLEVTTEGGASLVAFDPLGDEGMNGALGIGQAHG